MADRAVVTFASEEFAGRAARMVDSVHHVGFDGDVITFGPEYPEGWPTNREVPFAFKPRAVAEAVRRGARSVLWLDASCLAVRPLTDLFGAVDDRGYVLFRNGSRMLGEWAGDATLEWFGVYREDAMAIPEVNAAALGLNVDHPVGAEFLRRWVAAADAGTPFRGRTAPMLRAADYPDVKWNRNGAVSADRRVRGHRHDQTVAGLIAHDLGLELIGRALRPARLVEVPALRAAGPTILVVRDEGLPNG